MVLINSVSSCAMDIMLLASLQETKQNNYESSNVFVRGFCVVKKKPVHVSIVVKDKE